MFQITKGKGFTITFDNGYVVSVQWGCMNYCDNYNLTLSDKFSNHVAGETGSTVAEVAHWHGSHIDDIGGQSIRDVKGYQTPAEVLAYINEIASKPNPMTTQTFEPVRPIIAVLEAPAAIAVPMLFGGWRVYYGHTYYPSMCYWLVPGTGYDN